MVSCQTADSQEHFKTLRLAFYNAENFFDPFDDSLRNDEEFLPGGIRNWTWERYLEKERKIYKVIAGVGGWEAPAKVRFLDHPWDLHNNDGLCTFIFRSCSGPPEKEENPLS